jgi:hypothetical protein
MAWTTPLTAVANAAFTAAQFNASVRDNLLMTSPALATTAGSIFAVTGTNTIAQRIPDTASVTGAAETTNSTSYTGTLSGGGGTAGPSLTLTTGPKALISFHCRQSTSGATTNVWTSVAVSGASSLVASDNYAISTDIISSQIFHGLTYLEKNLTAGSNTFQMQYRVTGGTGTFAARRIDVVLF